MTGRLQGKTVLVAGAAGNMGSEIVSRALDEGANLVAADAREDALKSATASCSSERLTLTVLDVTDETSWSEAVALAESTYGGLHGLVNSAAILNRTGVEATTVESWQAVTAVNELGAWLGLRAATPVVRKSGGGSLVLIGSIDSLVGRGRAIAYQASKGALRLIARSAAVELARDAIRVNTVCPGIMSDRMAFILGEGKRPTDGLQRTPLGRQGTPADVAWAVVYLLSDESSFVTGTDLVVDGGFTAQ